MTICVLKRILHKDKAIFWIIIPKWVVPQDVHLQQQKGHEKHIFETLHNEIKCVLSVKEDRFHV